MKVVLAGLLLLVCVCCGGADSEGAEFAIYHLESAIGPPGADGELRCGPPRVACPGILDQPVTRVVRYAVLGKPALTGEDIERASARRAADPETGAAVVRIDLTSEGSKAFARVTRQAARLGGRDLGWHHVAVVVGDEIVAFPEIDYDVHPDGIADAPRIQILAANEDDAGKLAGRLRGEDD